MIFADWCLAPPSLSRLLGAFCLCSFLPIFYSYRCSGCSVHRQTIAKENRPNQTRIFAFAQKDLWHRHKPKALVHVAIKRRPAAFSPHLSATFEDVRHSKDICTKMPGKKLMRNAHRLKTQKMSTTAASADRYRRYLSRATDHRDSSERMCESPNRQPTGSAKPRVPSIQKCGTK